MIEKIKKFYKKNKEVIGKTYKNYIVTISIILLFTIVIMLVQSQIFIFKINFKISQENPLASCFPETI